MNTEIQVVKDGNQRSIPSIWREPIREIVEAFVNYDFQLVKRKIAGVHPLNSEDAKRISENIVIYGSHLTSLSEETWETSACQWMSEYWDALIDLYTIEEGASDLVLAVRVYESSQGYEFQVKSVYVP